MMLVTLIAAIAAPRPPVQLEAPPSCPDRQVVELSRSTTALLDPWRELEQMLDDGRAQEALVRLRGLHATNQVPYPRGLTEVAEEIGRVGRLTQMGELAWEAASASPAGGIERRRAEDLWLKSLVDRGRDEEAVLFLERTIPREKSASLRCSRRLRLGESLVRLGRNERAVGVLEEVGESLRAQWGAAYDEELERAEWLLYGIHARAGRWDEALRCMERWRKTRGGCSAEIARAEIRALFAGNHPDAEARSWNIVSELASWMRAGAALELGSWLARREGLVDLLTRAPAEVVDPISRDLFAAVPRLLRVAEEGDAERLFDLFARGLLTMDDPARAFTRRTDGQESVLSLLRDCPGAAAAGIQALSGVKKDQALIVLASLQGWASENALLLELENAVVREPSSDRSLTRLFYLLSVSTGEHVRARLAVIRDEEGALAPLAAQAMSWIPLGLERGYRLEESWRFARAANAPPIRTQSPRRGCWVAPGAGRR